MDAKQLRVGNWVYDYFTEKPTMVEGISKEDTSFGEYYYILHNGDSKTTIIDFDGEAYVSGIPLTPEILVKCGFEERKHLSDWYIKLPYSTTILSYNRNQFRICPVNSIPAFYIDCTYLHTLQNVYFALTQTELIIEF